MKADNDSLTDDDRKNLSNAAYQIFMEPFHMKYINDMLASTNPKNIKTMFDGFQTAPKPYGGNGFEILMWANNGTIETPWYGQPFDETYYKTDKHHHMVLEFPEDLVQQVGSGSLVIEIEVDTHLEYVEYQEGSRFILFESFDGGALGKRWDAGERFCQNKSGGHLASILSDWEQQQLKKVAKEREVLVYGSFQSIWLGGRKEI